MNRYFTVGRTVSVPSPVFSDRREAGKALGEFVPRSDGARSEQSELVLGLANGGVLVAAGFAAARDQEWTEVGVALAKKLPIPGTTEAGFGAVSQDGDRVLNESLVARLRLGEAQIDAITASTKRRLQARQEAFGRRPLSVTGRRVYLVDDGLASGYTMRAAALMVRRSNPAQLLLAVPVAPTSALEVVQDYFDGGYCLLVQETTPFAVASFYRDFRDVTDAEVKAVLEAA